MILPSLKWLDWQSLRARSLEINREAIRQLNAENPPVLYDPVADDALFLDSEDAFLDDSARALGLDRSTLEQLAAAGQIQWRDNFCVSHEIRYDGRIECLSHYPRRELLRIPV